jgi:hypothetical protein
MVWRDRVSYRIADCGHSGQALTRPFTWIAGVQISFWKSECFSFEDLRERLLSGAATEENEIRLCARLATVKVVTTSLNID